MTGFFIAMPGLYGIVSFDKKPDSRLYDSLGKKVSAFDSPVYSYHDDCVQLGFKTLNIVDMIDQPFFEQRMHLILFFWGEVFSDPFDDQSVSHSLFDFYLHDRLDRLSEINGLYSFVLWDEGRKRLVLGSDIYASRPLYYCEYNNQLVFSPSPLILAQVLAKNKINREVIPQFLSTGLILGDQSFSEDIRKLRHGRYLVYSEKGIKRTRYFRAEYRPEKMSLNDAATTLAEKTHDAAQRMTEGNISLSLSGGSDSRLMAISMIKAGYRPPAFTIGQSNGRDIEIAEDVCKAFNLRHHPLVITPDFLPENLQEAVYNTHGYDSAINFHGISIRHEVKKFADIVVGAMWGNEFVGYLSAKLLPFSKARHDDDFYKCFLDWHQNGFTIDELKDISTVDLPYDSLERAVMQIIRENRQDDYLQTFLTVEHFEVGSQYKMAGLWLENDLLEFRNIFLDYELMRFNFSVPAEYKLLMKLGRHIWRFVYPQAGKIRYQRTNLPLSASLLRVATKKLVEKIARIKHPPGIFDYADAFRNPLANWLKEMLCSDKTISREYLKAKILDRIVNDHIESKVDNTEKIGLLLTFEQTLRILDDD